MNRRPRVQLIAPAASPEEAAAVAAVLEQLMRDTTPPPAPVQTPPHGAWKRAALQEGIARQAADAAPWI